jgi:hypothetical protein
MSAQKTLATACDKCHGLGYYDEGRENDDGSMSGGDYVECEKCTPPAAPVQEPLFWYRPCSNGMYEGPIHNAQIEEVRKQSGAWIPLVPAAPPAAQSAPFHETVDLQFLKQVVGVAIAGLFEHYREDAARVFDAATLQEVAEETMGLCDQRVEDIYKRAWGMLTAPSAPAQPEPASMIRSAIADDAWAMSFQSLGQYRSALLEFIDSAVDTLKLHPKLVKAQQEHDELLATIIAAAALAYHGSPAKQLLDDAIAKMKGGAA